MKINGYETYNSILNSGGISIIVLFYILMVGFSLVIKIIIAILNRKRISGSEEEYEGGIRIKTRSKRT